MGELTAQTHEHYHNRHSCASWLGTAVLAVSVPARGQTDDAHSKATVWLNWMVQCYHTRGDDPKSASGFVLSGGKF